MLELPPVEAVARTWLRAGATNFEMAVKRGSGHFGRFGDGIDRDGFHAASAQKGRGCIQQSISGPDSPRVHVIVRDRRWLTVAHSIHLGGRFHAMLSCQSSIVVLTVSKRNR